MSVKNDWWLWALIAALVMAVAVVVLSGCDDGLRFAPSQALKQNAELTHQLAAKVNEEGTEPKSPASVKLVKGTETSLTYIGRPVVPVEADEFDTVNKQADADAGQRPDVSKAVNGALELGIGLLALLGGGVGVKGVQILRTMQSKAQGFEELVKANELFKQRAEGKVNGDFKAAQNEAQSVKTKQLVAQARVS